MDNLDISKKLIFDNNDLTDPVKVIKEITEQIEVQTRGIVKGTIEPYDDMIFSHRKPGFAEKLAISTAAMQGIDVDIQEKLGKEGEMPHRFEFYLSTPVFSKYRYRVCFFQFGLGYYPTTIVVERSIAEEINYGNEYIFNCNNPDELRQLFEALISTSKSIQVMQELINIHQIYKDVDLPSQELQIDNADNNDDGNNN